MDLLHPIRLMARTDAELTTVLHSIFLFHFSSESLRWVLDCHHPQQRKNLEAIEDGLKGLLFESITTNEREKEKAHSFVLTNHDGRLYAFAVQQEDRIIALVTTLPLFSFCRSLLDELQFIDVEAILPMIYAFCEMPIFPAPFLRYTFSFTHQNSNTIMIENGSYREKHDDDHYVSCSDIGPPAHCLDISFSTLEHVNDLDVDFIVHMILTPLMIVKAWEALVVERRILVVTMNTSLLLPCCEFLRRLAAPMPFAGTFIPVLPLSGYEAVEAPGNFLIGAHTNALREANKDLTGVVIIDLDKQVVNSVNSTTDDPYYCAPPFLIAKLVDNVTSIIHEGVFSWYSRTSDQGRPAPQTTDLMHKRTAAILSLFLEANTMILSSQFCSIHAFFRSAACPSTRVRSCFPGLSALKDQISRSSPGFYQMDSVCMGCVQRWRESDIDHRDTFHFTVPSWIEMDRRAFVVYEMADDLPIIIVRIEEIEAVLASSLEPEGHVFEVLLRNQHYYRFTTAEKESKQMWMVAIEERMRVHDPNCINTSIATGSEATSTVGSPLPDDGNHRNSPPTSDKFIAAFNDPTTIGSNPLNLGHYTDLLDFETNKRYFDFRDIFRSTQLVLNLYNATECDRFGSIFANPRGEGLFDFLSPSHSYEASMSYHIGKMGRTVDILSQMQRELTRPRSNGVRFDKEDCSSCSSKEHKSLRSRFTKLQGKGQLMDIIEESHSGDESEQTKPRRGLFSRLFAFSNTNKEATAGSPTQRMKEQQSVPGQTNNKDNGEITIFKQDVKDELAITAGAYQRCSGEVSARVVEDRLAAFATYFSKKGRVDEEEERFEIVINFQSLVQRILTGKNMKNTSCCSSPSPSSPCTPPAGDSLKTVELSSKKDNNGHHQQQQQAALAITRATSRSDKGCLVSSSSSSCTLYEKILLQTFGDGTSGKRTVDGSVVGDQSVRFEDNSEKPSLASPSNDLVDIGAIYEESTFQSFETLHLTAKEAIKAAVKDDSQHHLLPVLEVLFGYALHSAGDHSQALRIYGQFNLVDQRRVMECLLALFSQEVSQTSIFAENFSELSFICKAAEINPTIGLHAYRLCLELLHTELRAYLGGRQVFLEPSLMLKSFRHLAKTTLAINSMNRNERRLKSQKFKRIQFTWAEAETKTDIVNEVYTCTQLDTTMDPCEISAGLVLRLREILKSYAHSSAAEKYCSKTNGQLRKISLAGMTLDQRLMFFLNVFNTLMIHGIVRRGHPGMSFLERIAFMRATKYNLGGEYFSLVDIEHGVLRNASNPPILLGPLTYDMGFSDRDPRKKYALEEPRPNISFCLFYATPATSALYVFTNPQNIKNDMRRCSKQFFLESVKLDLVHRTIVLPEIIRFYWADFGKKQSDVLKHITNIAGSNFATRIRDYVNALDSPAVKTTFMSFDWTPMFILSDQ
eukprot:scaffold3058_cov165-Ochromonas_danica.AAC.19